MSVDPNRWVNTIPFIGSKSNQEKYKLDSNRWINTLPKKDDNILIQGAIQIFRISLEREKSIRIGKL